MNFIKCIFTLSTLFLCSATAIADTIRIEQVKMRGPEILQMPYSTSTKNAKGETFNVQEFLKSNTKWIKQQDTSTLKYGETILPASFDSTALGLVNLRFTLETDRFAKVQLKVEQLKNYKLYVDEKEQNGKNIQLTPGRVEVAILTFTPAKGHMDINAQGFLVFTGKKGHACLQVVFPFTLYKGIKV